MLWKSYTFIFYIRQSNQVLLNFPGNGNLVDLIEKDINWIMMLTVSTKVPCFILPTVGDFVINSFWFKMYIYIVIDQRQPFELHPETPW